MCSPLISGQRAGGNHRVMAFSAPISPPAIPSPINPRPIVKAVSPSPSPKISAPTAENSIKDDCTRRGP